MNKQGRASQLQSQSAQAHRLALGATDARLCADLTALGREYDRDLAALRRELRI